MIHTGLVSVTFRQLAPREIVNLVRQAGLESIEWGGDIHVPHGDLARAREVHALSRDAGLQVASYGSYYRVGHEEPVPFEDVMETALALCAPVIRVWAGKLGSAEADVAYRQHVVEESRRIAGLAAQADLLVAYECHRKTLTDTYPSGRQLLQEVGHDHLRTYWQPTVGESVEQGLAGLDLLLPWLSHVHVFHWGADTSTRYALAEGTEAWRCYLAKVATIGGEHHALLEFVPGDAPDAFLRDAATLRSWLA
jgi:3-dehydroshikimate dehydratase